MAPFDITRSMERLDYCTINLARLRRLPVYRLPPTYHLSDPGSACSGDAPGYPTYFLRHIYTQYGDTPPYRRGQRTAPDYVITDPETGKHHQIILREGSSIAAQLRFLWRPLPYEHRRVALWLQSQYVHFAHCYYTPEPGRYGVQIYIPLFEDEGMLSDLVTDENHYAVRHIRTFYPEHAPIAAWIDRPPAAGYEANNRFWEVCDTPLEEIPS